MTNFERGLQLHDKASKGIELSGEEQVFLQNWYAEQDNLEMNEINLQDSNTLSLQKQIEETLDQLSALTNNLRIILIENNKIRTENAKLRDKITQLFSTKAA